MTLRDWIASRTNKYNAAIASLAAVATGYIAMLSPDEMTALGLSPKAVVIGLGVAKIADSLVNLWLRAVTTAPLEGRAEQ